MDSTHTTHILKYNNTKKVDWGGGGPRGKLDLPDRQRHILTCRQNFLPSCMCWVICNNLWVSTSRIFGCLVFTRTAYSAKKSSADKLAKHITVRIRVPQRLCKYYRDEYYLLSFFGGYYGRKLHKYRFSFSICSKMYLLYNCFFYWFNFFFNFYCIFISWMNELMTLKS